jgi:small conductance mechanosensitive channel
MIDLTLIQEWINTNYMNVLVKIFSITVLWIIAYLFVNKLDRVITKRFWPLLKKIGLTRRKFSLLDDIFDLVVYVIAVILTLQILELTSVIYTALTAAGVIGIIVGFAVKDIASNMISGVLLKLNQPFIEGDVIGIDEKYKGTVTKISLYYTSIVDFQGIVTSLPNSLVISKPLTNFSHQTERLININVSISKDNDIDKALMVLKDVAEKEKNKLENRQLDVFVNDIKEYMVNLTLRFWVDVKKFASTKRRIIKEIAKAFKKNKIELAVPMRKNI